MLFVKYLSHLQRASVICEAFCCVAFHLQGVSVIYETFSFKVTYLQGASVMCEMFTFCMLLVTIMKEHPILNQERIH